MNTEKDWTPSPDSPEQQSLLHNASNIISVTSHELKTPLTAISATVELLSAKLQADDLLNAFYKKHLASITTEIFHMNSLLDEMLTLHNIISGSIETTKEYVDVQQVVLQLKEQYFTDATNNRTLEVHITGQSFHISVNKNQLARILINLIGNAFKFSISNNPVLLLDYQQEYLFIQITDDGIGIPAADLPYLFRPYYRGSNASGIDGTGLGLSIVKAFVKENEGDITVESIQGKGTIFRLSFKNPYFFL
jgi:signal transduction histidine kinase